MNAQISVFGICVEAIVILLLHNLHDGTFKSVFLKIAQNSQENNCAGISFSYDFNKNEALSQVISCKFCELFKNIFFTERLWQLFLDLYSREPIFIQATIV